MTNKKLDLSFERQFLTGLIISDAILREVVGIYKPIYLQTSAGKIVANWCLDYFAKYEKAPQLHIQDIFNGVVREGTLSEADETFISSLLESLSEEFERHSNKFNSDYLLDQIETTFKQKALKNLSEDMALDLSRGDIKGAESRVASFNPVLRNISAGINPFTDKNLIKGMFEENQEPLFIMPGELGKMMNREFLRDSFIAFLAPEKRGKSFLLIELAMRAHRAGCNVAFFEAGDMSMNQRLRRMFSYITKSPARGESKKVCLPILDCEFNQDDTCQKAERTGHGRVSVDAETNLKELAEAVGDKHRACSECREDKNEFSPAIWFLVKEQKCMTWVDAYRGGKNWYEKVAKGKGFKLSVHENSSLNVKLIRSQLETWEKKESFIPDVIFIDYADIMAPEDGRKDSRGQENDRWKALRALSQNRHACVITVTQADANSYDKENLSLSNFSEDKRKYAHVTAMYSLNQTYKEKRKNLMRIGELLVREDDFDTMKKVHVLQCFDIGRAYMDSF